MYDAICSALREKRIELLLVVFMGGILFWAMPLAIDSVVCSAVDAEVKISTNTLHTELQTTTIDIAKKSKAMMGAISSDVRDIKDMQTTLLANIDAMIKRQNYDTIERGIAGFNKCRTIECLEQNPNNRINIKHAMRIPEGLQYMLSINRDRAELFSNYFFDPDI